MVPLRALYVLPEEHQAPDRGQNPVGTRFFPAVDRKHVQRLSLDPARLKQQFAFAGKVTAAVPIRQLSFPKVWNCCPLWPI